MRLKPGVMVLLREPGHVQIGLSPPLGLPGLTREESAFLAALEGRRVAISSVERQRFDCLLSTLAHHGLLERDRPESHLAGALVRVRGADAITAAVASGLARAGLGALSPIDRTRLQEGGFFGTGAAGLTGGQAMARAVRDTHPGVRLAGAEERATLELLGAHGAADFATQRRLTALDVPHLSIVTDEAGVDIGPLVVPGVTACETCLGIAQTERDPWWPRIALQLGDTRRRAALVVPPDVALVAAGLALREALRFLGGDAPSGVRWRVCFDRSPANATVHAPHPDCGCGAAGPQGESAAVGVSVTET